MVKREIYLSRIRGFYDSDLVKILVGIRKCGKSVILKEIINDKKYYVFLDEIQKVDKFEEVVNSLRASIDNISIFITGSNSKLLSNELSTVLSGRYVLFNIYPLSYKEFIELTGKNAKDEETFWILLNEEVYLIELNLQKKII